MASPKLRDSTILTAVIYLNLMVLSWTCKCCAVGLFAVQYWYIFSHGSFEVQISLQGKHRSIKETGQSQTKK